MQVSDPKSPGRAGDVHAASAEYGAVATPTNLVDTSNATLTTPEMLEQVVERAALVMGAEAGVLFLPQPGNTWLLAASYNLVEPFPEERRHLRHGFPGMEIVLASEEPVLRAERLSDRSRYVTPEGKMMGIQSWAGIPIKVSNSITGVLAVSSREYDAFNQTHMQVLKAIGEFAGLILPNNLAQEEALQNANTRLRNKVAELETIIESMSDGLILCDISGKIVKANAASFKILAKAPDELLGDSVLLPHWNQVPLDEQTRYGKEEGYGPLLRLMQTDEECTACSIIMIVNGETRYLSISASLIRNVEGAHSGAVVVLRDISDEQRASRLKEEFLSLLSHELRAPLTVIMGYAQMMERKLERSGAESDAKSARMIREQAIRMSGMVGDIVDSGRLESGVQNINKEKINIEELVEHVVTRMRMEQPAMPQGRDITLRVEPGLPPVLGDMRRIDQVLTNILSNAIKYSPDGSPISIEVKLEGTARGNHGSEQSNRFVLVSVTDQGIGIEEDERERIFERAYRSQRGQITSAQGLGLGLYICKLEVEAHGGTIGVDDGPGGVGSTFWFTIPVE